MLCRYIVYLASLVLITPIFAKDVSVDEFLKNFSKNSEFTCSLSVSEITPVDTFHYDGFLAVGVDKFYAHIGDDFYLQVDTAEMLTWSDGSDAYSIDGLPFFDLIRLKNELAEKFDITAKNIDGKIYIVGKRKGDDVSVDSFEFCTDNKFVPKECKIVYSKGNKIGINFCDVSFGKPSDKLFNLPKGVGIVR